MKKILEAPSRRVANIFNEVDTNFVEICNNLIRIIYPHFTLVNYAESQNEPTLPTLNDCYLVKETGTVWSLAVEKNDVILFNGIDWEILAHKITEINDALQALYFKAEYIEYSTNAKLTATTTQEAIDELVQILVDAGIIL